MTAPIFRLKRNGTVLATWSPPASDGPDTFPASRMAGTSARAFFDVPGGPAVYTVEYLGQDSILSSDINAAIKHRSLLVQGVAQT